MSIPCIILFDQGREIKRNIGFIPEGKLREFIKQTQLLKAKSISLSRMSEYE